MKPRRIKRGFFSDFKGRLEKGTCFFKLFYAAFEGRGKLSRFWVNVFQFEDRAPVVTFKNSKCLTGLFKLK